MGRRSPQHQKVNVIKIFDYFNNLIGSYELNDIGKLKKPLKLMNARKKYERNQKLENNSSILYFNNFILSDVNFNFHEIIQDDYLFFGQSLNKFESLMLVNEGESIEFLNKNNDNTPL